MDTITIKKNKLLLNPNEIQISPLGRPFRLSGISIDVSKSPKYIKGSPHHCTSYIFIYTDNQELFGFYFDEYDKFVKKLTHNDICIK